MAKIDDPTAYHVSAYRSLRDATDGWVVEGKDTRPSDAHGPYRVVRPATQSYRNDPFVLCVVCGACRSARRIRGDGGRYVAGPCSDASLANNTRGPLGPFPVGSRMELTGERSDLETAIAACDSEAEQESSSI